MSETQWDSSDRAEAEAIDGVDARRARWTEQDEAEYKSFRETLVARGIAREADDLDRPF